jgi:hypothetical protein
MSTVIARASETDLESRALRMLTDDQAMASFVRWRTGCGAVVAPSLHEPVSVEAYVDLIFQKVPA